MDDSLFSHESLLSPERLFGVIVAMRQKKPPAGAEKAFEAFNAMREVHPAMEYHNRRLFMSSVAEDMNLLGSGVVEYENNPSLSETTPIRTLSPEQIESEQAHIAYLNSLTAGHIEEKEALVTDDIRRQSVARQNLEAIYRNRAA